MSEDMVVGSAICLIFFVVAPVGIFVNWIRPTGFKEASDRARKRMVAETVLEE